MTSSFRIQWDDQDNNQSGSFYGRNTANDEWEPLDEFVLTATSYDFYLSVSDGVGYVTFVSIVVGEQTFGAKIPMQVHDDQGDAIALGPLPVSGRAVEVHAWLLISDDPRINVTWGKGGTTNQALVQLVWTGSTWTDGTGGPITDPIEVESFDRVVLTVSDQSRDPGTIGVYQAQRLVGLLLDGGDGAVTIVLEQPSGAIETTYTVNVFDRLYDGGVLAVS
jgi:hypothetical protein